MLRGKNPSQMEVYLFASLIALAAYFVRGIAGFGSALVASPLLAAMAPAAWLGLQWGQRLHFAISPVIFRHIIGLLLMMSGGTLLWRLT